MCCAIFSFAVSFFFPFSFYLKLYVNYLTPSNNFNLAGLCFVGPSDLNSVQSFIFTLLVRFLTICLFSLGLLAEMATKLLRFRFHKQKAIAILVTC